MKDRQYELIDRFFTGDLNETEDREFRDQMKDKAFSKAVDLQQRLRGRLISSRRESPLGQLLEAEAAKVRAAPASSPKLRRLIGWSAAAAVLLLLAAAGWWSNNHYGDEALAIRFHQPIYDDTQAGLPDARDLMQEAKRAFFRGDFARSEEMTNAISISETWFYQQAQALKVYALFNQKKYPETIIQANQTLVLEPLTFVFPEGGSDKLRWTRMLAYVGTGNTKSPEFREDLDFFLRGLNESYRTQAEELRSMLDSGWRKLVF